MSVECKHGFEPGFCDTCFPKPAFVPEPKEPVKRVGRTRAPARTPGTPKAAPVSTTKLPTFNAGELRLYHVTHISNLPAILESGKLFAASGPDAATPVVDISSVENREARKTVFVAGQQDSPVSAFVPFFLSPDAALWRSIRSGNPDSRLAADVAEHSINDFVVLVTTIDAVSVEGVGALANVVVADGDAAGSLTPFAANSASAVRMLRKLRSDEEAEALLEAEVLVADAVPVDNIALIGVANVKVREAVKRMLAPTPYATKVAAYTPWFEAVE